MLLFLRLFSSIVVGQLNPDLARIFAFAIESLPYIAFTASGDNNIIEAHPGFTNQIGPFILAKEGNFQVVIVGRIVHGEAKLLVPVIG